MKIAMIFDGLGFGGIERVGVDYIKMLTQLGHQITVFNLNPRHTDMEQELEAGTEVIHHSFPRNVCPYRYAVLKKRGIIGKCAYGLGYVFFSILQICKQKKEGYKDLEFDVGIAFSGHYNDLTFLTQNFLQVKKKVAWLHGGVADYAEISDGFLNLYSKIGNLVTLSSENEQKVIQDHPILNNIHIQKIYNPSYIGRKNIDPKVVTHLKESYGNFILMIGRFTLEKDHQTIVDTMELLSQTYQIRNKLVFVGDGENLETIKEYVKAKKLEDQIIFTGKRYDVQNFYKAATLYVHASPAEGLPTVLIEAMEFGVPIVTTNSKPGVPEVLENGQDGIVCKLKDSSALADGIHQLLTNQELYQYYVNLEKKRSIAFDPTTIKTQLENYLLTLK